MGDYVHLCSGAAGVDLSERARSVFHFGPKEELQLLRAKADMPGVSALYSSSGSSAPCASLCLAPTVFGTAGYNSGQLGTGATCHQTTASLAGFTCGSFNAPRSLAINGEVVTCNNQSFAAPPKRNGGYCIQASAGEPAWAYFSTY